MINIADGGDIQNYLATKTHQRTVPNIFIGGKHVGGKYNISKIFFLMIHYHYLLYIEEKK